MLLISLLGLVMLAMPKGPKRTPAVTVGDLVARRRLYPIAEAAELLGMCRASLYNRRAEGKITFVHVGARTYVTADELERFIAAAEPARTRSA